MSAITEPTIPETVEIPGETLVELLVELRRAETALLVESDHSDTPGLETLGDALGNLYWAAFGKMFRDCDLGTEAQGCRCAACNGDESEAGTPIFRLILERAEADPVETKSLYADDLSALSHALTRNIASPLDRLELAS